MSYKNIADIYAKSRPPYPQELFKRIIDQVSEHNRELYIDLGCGTGELLLPLSVYFQHSIGVDPEAAMLAVVGEKIAKQRMQNINVVVSAAAAYLAQLPNKNIIDLVTAGRSFHWMDQKKVVAEINKRLRSGGVFATLGEVSGGIWKRQDEWSKEVQRIICEEFPQKTVFKPIRGKKVSLHEMQKAMSTIGPIEEFFIEVKQQWTIDMILNLFYSAAGFLDWLNGDKSKFEQMVRTQLQKIDADKFESISCFGVTYCIKK